jgi:hypothetical protein
MCGKGTYLVLTGTFLKFICKKTIIVLTITPVLFVSVPLFGKALFRASLCLFIRYCARNCDTFPLTLTPNDNND